MSDLGLWLFVVALLALMAALGVGVRRGALFPVAAFRAEGRRTRLRPAPGDELRARAVPREAQNPTPEFFEMARALLLSQPASEIRDRILAQLDAAVAAESERSGKLSGMEYGDSQRRN